MALPRENKTAKVIEINDAINRMSPQELSALPTLDEVDFSVFGALIQHFCFIDLNLRRALEVFAIAKILPNSVKNRYPNLPDSELTGVLVDVVKAMDATVEDIPRALTFLEGISKTRAYRNLVGHFAGRRFPNKDVYVFVSKSDKDARKAGISLGAGHVYTAVVGRSEFLAMTNTVGRTQLWLATKYQEWEQRYPKPSSS
jgi:hypothetical protein